MKNKKHASINNDSAPDEATSDDTTVKSEATPRQKRSLLHGIASRIKQNKKVSIPAIVLGILLLMLAIPQSRYPVLGLFIKRTFIISIVDTQSNNPITSASVTISGITKTTDNKGSATFQSVKVGNSLVNVSKKYYKGYTATVLIGLKQQTSLHIQLQATGRQVPIVVQNIITKKPVSNALITILDTQGSTDQDGKVTIVVPADKTTLSGTIKTDKYNDQTITVKVIEQIDPSNTFSITPTGKVYFLSKLSGKIDVVKTNLDGTNRQTVIAGTGKEDDTGTIMIASRDWKYLALLSRRDSDLPKLYLIDTSTDKMTTIDEGNATFSLVGWDNDSIVYLVNRNGYQVWQANAASLKSFDAQSGKLTIIDNTQAAGTNDYDAVYETFNTFNIALVGNSVVYAKTWYQSYYYGSGLVNHTNNLVSVNPDNTNRKIVSSLSAAQGNYADIELYEAETALIQVSPNNNPSPPSYYELDASGNFKANTTMTQQDFSKTYPVYLISPSGKASFWSEPRDGKNTLLVGDQNGDNGKSIASLSDYETYGWFTEDYVLVSKNSSELYIMPATGGDAIKITDYHKPIQNFNGYGGGYGFR